MRSGLEKVLAHRFAVIILGESTERCTVMECVVGNWSGAEPTSQPKSVSRISEVSRVEAGACLSQTSSVLPVAIG